MFGTVLTHRLDASEILSGRLMVEPDLALLSDMRHGDIPDALSTGGELTLLIGGDGVESITGPDGWLDEAVPGQLATFRIGEHQLEFSLLDDGDLGDEAAARATLRDRFDQHREPEGGIETFLLVLPLDDGESPVLAEPVRPISELMTDLGFTQRDGQWGPVDEPWVTRGEQHRAALVAGIGERFGFERCCQQSFDRLWAALSELTEGTLTAGTERGIDQRIQVENPARLLDDLAHGDVAAAIVDLTLTRWDAEPWRIEALIEALESDAGDANTQGRAALGYLEGQLADARGDGEQSEAAVRRAHDADPSYVPAREELAIVLFEQGDLDAAVALLHQPDFEPGLTEAVLTDLRDALFQRFDGVGRNDVCPCGSGRKFKKCCSIEPRLTTDDRLILLDTKLTIYGGRVHHRAEVNHLMGLIDDESEIDELLVAEALQVEGGLLAAYRTERGHLLPEVERSLLDEMIERGRHLYRVGSVTDETIELEPITAGRPAVVRNDFNPPPPAGDLMLARLVTDGDLDLVVGFPIPIDDELEAAAIDGLAAPSAGAFLVWVASRDDEIPMHTASGEPIVLGGVGLECGDRIDEVRAWLDGRLPYDPDTKRWGTDLGAVGTGPFDDAEPTLEIDGSVLTIAFTTVVTRDRLVAELTDAFGEFEPVHDSAMAITRGVLRRASDDLSGPT